MQTHKHTITLENECSIECLFERAKRYSKIRTVPHSDASQIVEAALIKYFLELDETITTPQKSLI